MPSKREGEGGGMERDAILSGPPLSNGPEEDEPLDQDESQLFVGDLSKSLSESELVLAFSLHGSVTNVSIKRDRATHKNLGYGFVSMQTHAQARVAKAALHGKPLGGRRLRVGWAQKNSSLYVTGLAPGVTVEVLNQCFERFGPLDKGASFVDIQGESQQLPPHQPGRCRYGLIKFEYRAHAKQARDEINGTLEPRLHHKEPVSVEWYSVMKSNYSGLTRPGKPLTNGRGGSRGKLRGSHGGPSGRHPQANHRVLGERGRQMQLPQGRPVLLGMSPSSRGLERQDHYAGCAAVEVFLEGDPTFLTHEFCTVYQHVMAVGQSYGALEMAQSTARGAQPCFELLLPGPEEGAQLVEEINGRVLFDGYARLWAELLQGSGGPRQMVPQYVYPPSVAPHWYPCHQQVPFGMMGWIASPPLPLPLAFAAAVEASAVPVPDATPLNGGGPECEPGAWASFNDVKDVGEPLDEEELEDEEEVEDPDSQDPSTVTLESSDPSDPQSPSSSHIMTEP
ncbi:unnamed protein product [Chrysoparadoxa australica]